MRAVSTNPGAPLMGHDSMGDPLAVHCTHCPCWLSLHPTAHPAVKLVLMLGSPDSSSPRVCFPCDRERKQGETRERREKLGRD